MSTTTATTGLERSSALQDTEAALMRLRRAVDSETEPLYARKDAGGADALPVLSRIGFLLLELGFTVAEEGGIDPAGIEHAVSHAYGLPTD